MHKYKTLVQWQINFLQIKHRNLWGYILTPEKQETYYFFLGLDRVLQDQIIRIQKCLGLKLDHNGNFIEFDFEAQCRSVFDNVKVILEESGSSWGELIDVTVFLVNMKRDFHIYNKVYAEYFSDNSPCRTTVEINSLPTPIAIELKCIATID